MGCASCPAHRASAPFPTRRHRPPWCVFPAHPGVYLLPTLGLCTSCPPRRVQVCAVTEGGAFAEEVVARENVVVKLPDRWGGACAGAAIGVRG